MTSPYQITIDELAALMATALTQCGFPADYQARYIEAHRKHGWLRPNTPPDILALAELHYTLPSAEMLGPVIPPIPAPPRPKTRHAPCLKISGEIFDQPAENAPSPALPPAPADPLS